ncbi:class I SAM-dependent methyltransferase [Paramagnetospirillum magneticum]|uniref:SAM-dependent methyltransferase n=1 Tax=Paramagnetospirillum magneticum (strain ATCC 700264 / AMB-1) TaxID=342108 RepID=Q2VZT5_PARM1|nr:class I SAM-dependent methyltransferase [Paramagnetospirillum magneticum]BAE52890.1 SAM-dependent methyltransferase [Paramagnetospirillum magneticum AMB-1]
MSRDTVKHWDDARAAAYDKRVREAIPGYDALHVLSCQIVAETTSGSGRALVIGAGTGVECVALAESCPNLSVVGVDPSKDMLDHAEAKVKEHNLTARVRLYPSKVGDLPKFEPFDAATLLLVMHFLPDDGAKKSLLEEIAAHLKPGAPLVLADLFGTWDDAWQQQLRAWWRHLQLAAGIPEAEVEKGFRHVDRDIFPLTEARLAELLAETGFGPPEPYFRALCFGGWVARKA